MNGKMLRQNQLQKITGRFSFLVRDRVRNGMCLNVKKKSSQWSFFLLSIGSSPLSTYSSKLRYFRGELFWSSTWIARYFKPLFFFYFIRVRLFYSECTGSGSEMFFFFNGCNCLLKGWLLVFFFLNRIYVFKKKKRKKNVYWSTF